MSQGSKPLSETSFRILEFFRLVRSTADMSTSDITQLLNTSDFINEVVIKAKDLFTIANSSRVASRKLIILKI